MKVDFKQYEKLLDDIDGIDAKDLKRIEEKSLYNYNFYYFSKKGINYILLGESDDDMETTWYWCVGDVLLLVGYSYVNEEKIRSAKEILS